MDPIQRIAELEAEVAELTAENKKLRGRLVKQLHLSIEVGKAYRHITPEQIYRGRPPLEEVYLGKDGRIISSKRYGGRSCIYMVQNRNLPRKIYVGKTQNLLSRRQTHSSAICKFEEGAWVPKYGRPKDTFVARFIEQAQVRYTCLSNWRMYVLENTEYLDEAEAWWFDHLQPELNGNPPHLSKAWPRNQQEAA